MLVTAHVDERRRPRPHVRREQVVDQARREVQVERRRLDRVAVAVDVVGSGGTSALLPASFTGEPAIASGADQGIESASPPVFASSVVRWAGRPRTTRDPGTRNGACMYACVTSESCRSPQEQRGLPGTATHLPT